MFLFDSSNTCQPNIRQRSDVLGSYALQRYLHDRQSHEEMALRLWRMAHAHTIKDDRSSRELEKPAAKGDNK
jgi:hypothetical protein